MNKQEIIGQLIELTAKEINELDTSEREGIKEVTADQDNENKFESTREEEIGALARNNVAVADLEKRLEALKALNPEAQHETVMPGALVKLNTGSVLVATAFPSITLGEEKVTGISQESPLFQKMEGMKKGAEFHLTGHETEYLILDIH